MHWSEATAGFTARPTLVPTDANAKTQYELGKMLPERGQTKEPIEHLEAAARLTRHADYTHHQPHSAYLPKNPALPTKTANWNSTKNQGQIASAHRSTADGAPLDSTAEDCGPWATRNAAFLCIFVLLASSLFVCLRPMLFVYSC